MGGNGFRQVRSPRDTRLSFDSAQAARGAPIDFPQIRLSRDIATLSGVEVISILNLLSSIRLGFCGYRFCHTRVLLSGIHVVHSTWIPAKNMQE